MVFDNPVEFEMDLVTGPVCIAATIKGECCTLDQCKYL